MWVLISLIMKGITTRLHMRLLPISTVRKGAADKKAAYLLMDDSNEAEQEMAMHFNYVLLGKCTEIWVFGGVVSRGMAREICVAKKRRMKIRWFDHAMKEVNEYA